MLKEHEKFWAFILLGAGILSIAVLAVFHPLSADSGSLRVVDTISGGLLLAFGGAANALFRISNATEQQAIGEATAKAIEDRGVPVRNEKDPLQVEETTSEAVVTPAKPAPEGS